MRIAGAFHYQPAFQLDEKSEENLLEFEEIEANESEICRTIVDYEFDDVDSQVIYGEVGSEDQTDKFFLRANFGGEDSPEEVEIYVPQDQQNYPSSREFWAGFNDQETEVAEMTERVEEIAENFKQGSLVIINAQDLIDEQDGEPAEED
jgi:hypothetical protein